MNTAHRAMAKVAETGGGIKNAELPRDLPSQSENHFIVIICESDEIKWSLHDGASFNYAPTMFWTTPQLQDEDRSAPSCMSLTRFLCPHALTHTFGVLDLKSATKQNADRTAAKRKFPFTTVYVLSNNTQHEKDISFLFSEVPSRLFRLSNANFFTPQQMGMMTKPLISVGQFAALYGAKMDYKSPVLLLNGGSAITYVGLDKDSKFLGGGACAGMPIRCRTLFDYCSKDFPSIDFKKYKQITDKAKEDKKPISIFATDIEVSIAANATAEMAGQLRNIVKQFLKIVGPLDTPVTVVITGDDTDILEELLHENCSNMVEAEPHVAFPPSSKVTFTVRKNMVAYGIQHLLTANKKKQAPLDPDEEIREALIGLRGAYIKESNANKIYRGSIMRVVSGNVLEEDTFILLLDDGENIYLDLIKLYDSLALYAEVTEENKQEKKENWVGEKREALTKVQVNLEGKNAKIKERKMELDAAKKKDGSIVKTLAPPQKEKTGTKRPRPSPVKEEDPQRFICQRIGKYFDDPTPKDPNNQIIYFGTIDKYSKKSSLWHVTYDDDDEEEFDYGEICVGILLYSKNKDADAKNRSS